MNSRLSYNGLSYETRYGISSITLGPVVGTNGFRNAYYTPYGSIGLYTISTQTLQNITYTEREFDYIGDLTTFIGERAANTQSNSQVIDLNSSIMFFTIPNQNQLGCWNINSALTDINVAFADPAFTYPWDVVVR